MNNFFTDIITFEFSFEKDEFIFHLPAKVISNPYCNEVAIKATPEFINAMSNYELHNIIKDGICASGTGMKIDENRKKDLFGENEDIVVINYH